jgi:hypothetical protein
VEWHEEDILKKWRNGNFSRTCGNQGKAGDPKFFAHAQRVAFLKKCTCIT